MPTPRSFVSQDARNIRILRPRIFHNLKLGCLKWIRNHAGTVWLFRKASAVMIMKLTALTATPVAKAGA